VDLVITLDSCHSHWVFDPDRRRYRRVPQGPGAELRAAASEWRDYHELRVDEHSESFVVVLNHEGTRMLRSWRHTPGVCPSCGFTTGEVDTVGALTAEGGAADHR
jgi:hypothetical protein